MSRIRAYILALTAALAGTSALRAAAAPRSSIVIILADDFGYGSANCYGADPALVRTPHIDRLAREGVRFTDASTPSSVCSPTRYGLMLGRYPWRTPKKYGVVNPGDPFWPGLGQPSLAAWLKARGYGSAMIGKWHLGYRTEGEPTPEDWTRELRPGPLEIGFDYHYGIANNHGDRIGVYIENDRIAGLRSNRVQPFGTTHNGKTFFGFDAPQRVDENVMDVLTEKAVAWLRAQPKDRPFFLYFAPVAVHHPITPSRRMRGQSRAGPYGDFIQELDHSVGRVLQALDDSGLAASTLVIFTSDNGGEIPPQPEKAEAKARTAGLLANGMLRGDKHTIWEGGVRVPYVVRWPGRIPAGQTSGAMINLMDTFSTVAHLLDGSAPDPAQAAPDSFSFRDALLKSSGGGERRSMIVANDDGIVAIRRGPWKLVEGKYPEAFPVAKRRKDDPQAKRALYHLGNDPGEQVDILASEPAVAADLEAELAAIRQAAMSRRP